MMHIIIDISSQKMVLFNGDRFVKLFPVSTSKYGIGNKYGSNKTPIGLHRIASKIGKDAPLGSVFVKRRRTGKVVRIDRRAGKRFEGDFITTRILRLEGLEKGINKGEGVDSFRRCIYIHGTTDEYLIGRPASHGCIRMKNKDIVKLFDLIKRGSLVQIQAGRKLR